MHVLQSPLSKQRLEERLSGLAAEAAALAAWRVLGGGDRVGAMVFDDEEIVTVRPHRSRDQVMRVLGAIVEKNHALHAQSTTPANPEILNEALRRLIPLARHDCLICVIGDGSAVWGSSPHTEYRRPDSDTYERGSSP